LRNSSKLSEKAKKFKRAYKLEWKLSNQKEAFIKLWLESLGFQVRACGLGALEERRKRKSGSLPDFSVWKNNRLVAFVEVTGSNFYKEGDERYIILAKISRYYRLARKRQVPVYFVYLAFHRGKLRAAYYVDIRTALHYANNPDHHRIFITRWGTEEHFVWIPNSEWKPLSLLVKELNY